MRSATVSARSSALTPSPVSARSASTARSRPSSSASYLTSRPLRQHQKTSVAVFRCVPPQVFAFSFDSAAFCRSISARFDAIKLPDTTTPQAGEQQSDTIVMVSHVRPTIRITLRRFDCMAALIPCSWARMAALILFRFRSVRSTDFSCSLNAAFSISRRCCCCAFRFLLLSPSPALKDCS